MLREKVKSSAIKEIGWDDNIMEVKFTSDSVYKYENVPKSVFQALKDSNSIGKTFHTLIRGNYDAVEI